MDYQLILAWIIIVLTYIFVIGPAIFDNMSYSYTSYWDNVRAAVLAPISLCIILGGIGLFIWAFYKVCGWL